MHNHNHNHNHDFHKDNRQGNQEKQQTQEQQPAAEEATAKTETAQGAEEATKATEQATQATKQATQNAAHEATATETAETAEQDIPKIPQMDPRDKKIDELQNQLARLQADFSNVRKHTAQDQERLATFVTASVAKEFLKVLDNFDRAESSMEQQGVTAEAMHEGMTKIHKQFQQALQALKIEEIPAQGQKFNPELHEAVMQNTASDLPDETIDLVAEKGYKIGDNVIRHSKVRVVHKD